MPGGSTPSGRLVETALVGPDGLDVTIEAADAERRMLAEQNGLERIDRLAGNFRLRREGHAGIRVSGLVEGQVVQTCVVTLEPFPVIVSQPVDVRFLPERDLATLRATAAAPQQREDGDAAADDVPDSIVDGRIDLGTLMEEFLALGLDPYPRKPGAVFVEPAPPGGEGTVSPFAALSRLRAGEAER